MTFDVEGARRAGYSDTEIAGHLAGARGFNLQGARQAGYSDADIVAHLSRVVTPPDAGPQEAGTSTITPPPVVRGMPSASRGVLQGVGDLVQGGAQLLANSLPRGVVDSVNSATQAVNNAPVIGPVTRALGMTPATPEQINQNIAQRETAYQAARAADGDTGFDVGRTVGQVAAGLPVALAVPTGAGLLTAGLGGAAQGALTSALQPVTDTSVVPYADQKVEQVALGGGLGVVGGVAGNLVGRAIAPRMTPEVATLREAGVQLTPGQIAGGAVRRVENAATSIPFLGDTVRAAQTRGIETFNRGVANRVLKPLGETLPDDVPAGRELVGYVQQRTAQALNDAYALVKPTAPDAKYAADILRAEQKFLTPEMRATFDSIMKDRVNSRLAAGTGQTAGEAYQAIVSDLGDMARQYGTGASVAERELGKVLGSVQKAFQELLGRANPQARAALDNANAAFAARVRLETAAGGGGVINGTFTPAQFANAVQRTDRSVRHNAFARGEALLSDLADAGKSTLPSTVPDSGTPLRGALMALAGGSMAGVSVNPWAAAGGAGLAAAYTPWGQRAINAALARQPGAVAQGIGGAIGRTGGAMAPSLFNLITAP